MGSMAMGAGFGAVPQARVSRCKQFVAVSVFKCCFCARDLVARCAHMKSYEMLYNRRGPRNFHSFQ